MNRTRSELLQIVSEGSYRFEHLQEVFQEQFERAATVIISAPGRSELIGNHTDHNNGRVVAAAVDMDTLVLAAPSPDTRSRLVSIGWDEDFILDPKSSPESDTHDTQRLMRGVSVGLEKAGFPAIPFDAVMESRVLPGSGLSSSAALEISLVGIHEALSGSTIPPIDRAKIGRFAENEFIGKPSGLMDQMACSIGGCVAIDFADSGTPRYHQIDLDFQRINYRLAIVDTGGSHADLTPNYAAVPQEMHAVAKALGVEQLVETNKKAVLKNLTNLRGTVGDRAILRALHFFDEQERVLAFIDAVDGRIWERTLSLMTASGESSSLLLQNVYPHGDGKEQPVNLGLALTREYFNVRGATGAYRVHGGGFAGTILVVVPQDLFGEYKIAMDRAFGTGATRPLLIRKEGLVYATL